MKRKKQSLAKQLAKKMVSPYDVLGSWTGIQSFDAFEELDELDYPEQDVDDL